MANLKEKLFGLIDNGAANAMTLLDTINKTVDSIDWDAQFSSLNEMKESLLKKGEELIGDFNELMKQVKDTISDFKVIVPFNESIGEKFDCKVEGNMLVVEVTFKDETSERSNKTKVMIPENCDIEKLDKSYDSLKKTMTIIIPKKIIDPTDVKEEKVGFKLKKSATSPKKGAEETHETSTSKLLKKFRENASKSPRVTQRGANGRFVKKNVSES